MKNTYIISGSIGLNEWDESEFIEINEEIDGEFDTAKDAWDSFCSDQEELGIYSVCCFDIKSQSSDFGLTGITLEQRGTDCTIHVEAK